MILAFILINGIILGMETSPSLVENQGDLMDLGNHPHSWDSLERVAGRMRSFAQRGGKLEWYKENSWS